MASRNIGVHVFVFVGASVLALRAWTAEEEPSAKHVAAELWSGKETELEKIEFVTPKNEVTIEPKSDSHGRYYVGTVQSVPEPPRLTPAAPDAGAASAPAPAEPERPEPQRFVSVAKAGELSASLVTLRASRVLGKIDDDRLDEFGFDEADKGKLTVHLGGRTHVLAFGEKTPGGRDRYVRDPATGEGYVIAGSVSNDLLSAKNRLVERAFHDFGEEKTGKVVLSTGEQTRQVVRHATEKNFWASPDTADDKDETVSNWMTKLERLRVTAYLENPQPPVAEGDVVVRVTYFSDKGRELGFLELAKRPPEKEGERARYVARSERSRWYATVLRSTAEQLEQDLVSVITP